MCIEFDGAQHEIPVNFWGGKEGLDVSLKRDGIKNTYCDSKKIKLLRIPHTEFKNIEFILHNSINQHI